MPVLFSDEEQYQAEAEKVVKACKDVSREHLVSFINYSHVPREIGKFYDSLLTIYGTSGTYTILSYARLMLRERLSEQTGV